MIKIWTWLKTYWKIPLTIVILLIVGLATLSLFKKNGTKDIQKALEIAKDSYEEQIKIIEFENEKEKKISEKITAEYIKVKDEVEKKYNKERKILDKNKEKEIKKLVQQYHENPDELAKQVAKDFGINYVTSEKI